MNGWIGVDLDGTLAEYKEWIGPLYIGKPIPHMINFVKSLIADGRNVKIFTARVAPSSAEFNGTTVEAVKAAIDQWVISVFGFSLPITHEKDFGMVALCDDMPLFQVDRNNGRLIYHNNRIRTDVKEPHR